MKLQGNKFSVNIKEPLINIDKTAAQVVNCSISAHLTLYYLERIKESYYYSRELKRTGNLFLKELIKVEKKCREGLFNGIEDSSDFVQDAQFDLIEELGKLPPTEYFALTQALKSAREERNNYTKEE